MSRMTRLITPALSLLVATAAAHPTGVLKLGSNQIEVGAGISLRGEKMPKAGRMRLELRGALLTLALGEVRTDSAGAFETNLIVPETAKPGNYKLVALADDGDVTARADLMIVA